MAPHAVISRQVTFDGHNTAFCSAQENSNHERVLGIKVKRFERVHIWKRQTDPAPQFQVTLN